MELNEIESCFNRTPCGFGVLPDNQAQIFRLEVFDFLPPSAPRELQEVHDLNSNLRLGVPTTDGVDHSLQSVDETIIADAHVVTAARGQHDSGFDDKRTGTSFCFALISLGESVRDESVFRRETRSHGGAHNPVGERYSA
jgi:hypothetical protein